MAIFLVECSRLRLGPGRPTLGRERRICGSGSGEGNGQKMRGRHAEFDLQFGLRLVCAWFAPAIQGAAQTKSTLNSHGMTIPHHVRQPGGSIKVETVNSSPAPFGKNSANFLR